MNYAQLNSFKLIYIYQWNQWTYDYNVYQNLSSQFFLYIQNKLVITNRWSSQQEWCPWIISRNHSSADYEKIKHIEFDRQPINSIWTNVENQWMGIFSINKNAISLSQSWLFTLEIIIIVRLKKKNKLHSI